MVASIFENSPHFMEPEDPKGEQVVICQPSVRKRDDYVHEPCRENVRGVEV
jgi:hypothetical protein